LRRREAAVPALATKSISTITDRRYRKPENKSKVRFGVAPKPTREVRVLPNPIAAAPSAKLEVRRINELMSNE
jgi:hypothetical protein